VTVLDTSGVIDFLLGEVAFDDVAGLFRAEGIVAVPNVVVEGSYGSALRT
jgi:hypothetical protein